MCTFPENCPARFDPVDKRRELAVPFQRAAESAERFLAVGEGEFHRIGVNILTVVFATDFATSDAVTGDRPVVHQPTALVDLVDQVVNHVAGANPKQIDLTKLQLFDNVIGFVALVVHPTPPGQPVRADVGEFAQSTVAEFCRSVQLAPASADTAVPRRS